MIVRLTIDVDVQTGNSAKFVAESVDGELTDARRVWSPAWQIGPVTATVVEEAP